MERVGRLAVALKRGKWRIVLCRVIQSESAEDFRRALEAAREQGAWSVVMRLVKLGMDAAQRNSLFPEMLRQKRWGVCRELLDKGVSVQLGLAALPELMKLNQWTLVARVMEYDIGDDVREAGPGDRLGQTRRERGLAGAVFHGPASLRGGTARHVPACTQTQNVAGHEAADGSDGQHGARPPGTPPCWTPWDTASGTWWSTVKGLTPTSTSRTATVARLCRQRSEISTLEGVEGIVRTRGRPVSA